jgi:hypothetical protein
VIAEVEEVRGLKATMPIRVELLDAEPFAAKLREKKLGELASASELQAIWVAFGFAAPGTDASATVQQVVDEQVAGFYSPKDKALYVRARVDLGKTAGVPPELLLRGILAHEIEHALQDQVFSAFAPLDKADGATAGSARPSEGAGRGGIGGAQGEARAPHGPPNNNDDEALARLAVTEGDAQLTMLAVIAKERGITLKQALQNFAASVGAMSPEGLVRISGHSESLLGAPRLLRDTLLFPYIDGLELVGSAYLAGGLALVDRMFLHPPISTSQVLHPPNYAAGRPVTAVPTPAIPPDWKPISDGELGEVGTRAVLETCLPRQQAVATASSWRGDHFALATRPDGTLGLVWRVATLSVGSSSVLAGALRAQEPCWDKVRGAGPGSIGEPVQVLQEGKSVLVVRGVTPKEAAGLQDSWSKPLPRPPRSKPPLGKITLAPLHGAPIPTQVGRLDGSRYVDSGLALSAQIPEGFAARVGQQGVGLSVSRTKGGRGGGFFSYIPTAPTDELRRQTFAGFIGGMNASLGGGRHVEEEGAETSVTLPLGQGFEQRWKVSGASIEVRAAILPACGGRTAYLVGSVSSDADTRALLDRWMESFQIDANAKAPVCDALAAALGTAPIPSTAPASNAAPPPPAPSPK